MARRLFLSYDLTMWREYNNNPTGRNVGDCAVRAVSVALGIDWETAYAKLAYNGYLMGDLPNADATWGALLRQNGFYREIIPNTCPDCYTAEDFCNDHPTGVYVLAFGNHVATVKNGFIYDSWNSTNLIPIYFWHKKEGEE